MSPAVILIGGAALLFALGKGKNGGAVYFINADCQRITPVPQTEAGVKALVRRLAKVTAQAMTNADAPTSSAETQTWEGTDAAMQRALGPAPGDRDENLAFIRAYSLEMTRLLTNPKCKLAWPHMQVSDDLADWPEAAAVLGEEVFSGNLPIFAEHGYDVGVQFASAGSGRGLAHVFAGA